MAAAIVGGRLAFAKIATGSESDIVVRKQDRGTKDLYEVISVSPNC